MIPVSICVIMKNEEKNMESFLSSIKKHMGSYPYEIVLVDTGSTDRTLEIAKKYTDRIFHFEWINDFSAARNYSISCAKNDWILVLDCDEYIVEFNPQAFDWMAKNYPRYVGVITRRNHYELNGTDAVYTDPVERFFNRKLYHYEAIIHEQLRTLDGRDDYERVDISLIAEHCGYAGTPEEMMAKVTMIHDYENSCYYYGKGLEYVTDPQIAYVNMMVIAYGYALIHLDRQEEALMLENIYDDFCYTADFVCLMGIIYLRNGMILKAMQEFLKATTIETFNVEGANSFIPTYNMGCINEVLGNTEDAVKLYQKCGSFQPALERLAELAPDTLLS